MKGKNIKSVDLVKEANVAKVEEILASLGNIEKGVLSTAQKIQFAYLAQELNFSLRELFNYINEVEECEKHPIFVSFCEYQLKYKYEPSVKPKLRILVAKEKCEWLKPFDIKAKFVDKYGQPVKCYYMNKEGKQVEVTVQNATDIVNALYQKQIPVKSCIVNEAIRRYALDELDLFVEELTSGDYLSKEAKKQDKGSSLSFRIQYGRIIHLDN